MQGDWFEVQLLRPCTHTHAQQLLKSNRRTKSICKVIETKRERERAGGGDRESTSGHGWV